MQVYYSESPPRTLMVSDSYDAAESNVKCATLGI